MQANSISAIIRSMTPGQQEDFIATAQVRLAANTTLGKYIDTKALRYAADLIAGRQPQAMSKRRRLNGRVTVTEPTAR